MCLAATDGNGMEPEDDQETEDTGELFVRLGIGVSSWMQSTSKSWLLTQCSGVGISIARAFALIHTVARPGTAPSTNPTVRLT